MNFSDFQKLLPQLKISRLGGQTAQFKLAPALRLQYDDAKIKANNPKQAAVLALFYPDKNQQTHLMLTQRARYKGTHSAQISFPGGKVDNNDQSLEQTAKRETFEEVGILPSSVEIIQQLSDVYIPPSNFLVAPFLGYLTKTPKFKANYEVETIIEVAVADLLNDQLISTTVITNSYLTQTSVPCFKLNNYVVWGATAMMLSEIKELLKGSILNSFCKLTR